MAGRTLWFALPAAVAVFVGASSAWIAQRAPRFLFPGLAAAGAVLAAFWFVGSLARFVKRSRAERRFRVVPVLVNAVAVMIFVVLPLTHLLRVMTAPGDGAARILAGFGDWLGAEGYPRPSPHRGIDVGAEWERTCWRRPAAASPSPGTRTNLCGLIVVIDHDPYGYRTVYCHFSEIAVRPGESVERGQRIGAVGTSGQRAWPAFEHVHLELQGGRDRRDIEDPLPWIVGCFDRAKPYPTDRRC